MDAISLVLEQDYTRAEAARSLDINPGLLGRWVREHQADDGQAFRGNGKLTPEQEEIRKLKAQVKRLADGERYIKKSDGILCSRNEVKYSFITQHKNTYPISLQCQVLGVSRSGYYNYQATWPTSRMTQSTRRCWSGSRILPKALTIVMAVAA